MNVRESIPATKTSNQQMNGAEALVRMLQEHGVTHVFGLCGDTSLPFYDALYRLNHGITHILCRDERSAAYMADGYARVSGKVGVCEGPSGGGATYILPGLVEANESSIPVLGITTDVAVSSRGRYTLTELDQRSLFRPLTKWNAVIDRAEDIPRTVRAAFTHMTTGRPGAAHLAVPYDVQIGPVNAEDVWADRSLGQYPSRPVGPDPEAVRTVAAVIRRSRKPMFVVGGGIVIARAESQLAELAMKLGALVATTISGQGSIADNHPLAVGVVGSNGGTVETRELLGLADLVIFIGCRAGSVTTERWRYPSRSTKIVHIDLDPAVIGANYKTDVGVVGDARLVLDSLLSCLADEKRSSDAAAKTVARAKAKKFERFQKLASSDEFPILPERVVAALQATLPPDAVVVADPGTPCPYLSAYLCSERTGRTFISNRAHGALGYSLSAAVGAHFGRPGAKCVSVMGDGSFGFTAGELETVARLKLPITFIVFNNSVYGWIKAGQKVGFDRRYFSVDFSQTDHARVGEAFGLKCWKVRDPSELKGALAAAFAHDGPTLVDIISQSLHDAQAPVSEWVA
jgi:acetolactate synthase-1/2/3 large subunit